MCEHNRTAREDLEDFYMTTTSNITKAKFALAFGSLVLGVVLLGAYVYAIAQFAL